MDSSPPEGERVEWGAEEGAMEVRGRIEGQTLRTP